MYICTYVLFFRLQTNILLYGNPTSPPIPNGDRLGRKVLPLAYPGVQPMVHHCLPTPVLHQSTFVHQSGTHRGLERFLRCQSFEHEGRQPHISAATRRSTNWGWWTICNGIPSTKEHCLVENPCKTWKFLQANGPLIMTINAIESVKTPATWIMRKRIQTLVVKLKRGTTSNRPQNHLEIINATICTIIVCTSFTCSQEDANMVSVG